MWFKIKSLLWTTKLIEVGREREERKLELSKTLRLGDTKKKVIRSRDVPA
jgi:hypothetical protein